jgi:hypothetical protein
MPTWSRITNLVMRSPKGEYVKPGTETDAFVALDAGRIELKPGVTITEEQQPGGRVVYLLTSPTGGSMGSAECRCPSGYENSAECMKSWTEGGSTAQCSGTCTHVDIPTMTAKCGFFTAGPKKLFGLFRV